MADEDIFAGATLRDRFVAAVARDDESAAQQLTPATEVTADLDAQRDEAWTLLSAGVRWAGVALESVGVVGTATAPIGDSESAFGRAQHLDAQLWKLGEQAGFHDKVALLVESVKRACYRAAELGPVPGGRLAGFRAPDGGSHVVVQIDPNPVDLQAIGSELGDALRRFGELGLGDPVSEATAALGVPSA